MAFIKAKGIKGKVYVPDKKTCKKHNCKDCFSCQMCTDNRCRVCLLNKKNKITK